MQTNINGGIFTALLTPFDDQNNINPIALEKLINRSLSQGVSGFYVGGSTAEVFLLSPEERSRLYAMTKEIVGDRARLIAHVGAISTDQAIGYAKEAEVLGYDAISAIAPFYYNFGIEKIKKYYFDIVGSCELPMIIYNFPGFSGVNLSADTLKSFLESDRFLGVKFTSNDFFGLEQVKSAYPDKLVFNGYDEMYLAGLSMGADGAIGSTFNFMADKFVKIKALAEAGKITEAREIQATANKIITALIQVGVMEAEKEVLNLLGLEFGSARAPFKKVSKEESRFLEETVLTLL